MQTIDSHTLVRYFLGQSDEAEKEAIHQWIEDDEANRRQFIRERIRFDASLLADLAVETARPARRAKLHPAVAWSLRIAVSLLLLLAGAYSYHTYETRQQTVQWQTVYVPAGNRTRLQLPDGTDVWLNANTSMRYPTRFAEGSRTVELDGEAYFEVAKGEDPFRVETPQYRVEVLGTTFDVEAYSSHGRFQTTLYEGRVKLSALARPDEAPVYLSPGQTAQQTGKGLRVLPTGQPEGYRWKEGLICIEGQTFPEIMQLFEKFFDVRIIIQNQQVNGLSYRGKLRISDGVGHALRVLQNDFPFSFRREEEGKIIYID